MLVTEHRAQSAADGAAHAAVGELVADAWHDDIALLVSRDAGACWWAAAPVYGRPGAALDGRCSVALKAAVAVVQRTPAAQLLSLTIVADVRDNQAMSDGAGRLDVLALVAVARTLPVLGRTCDDFPEPRSTLCFAVAASAAQEA